MDKLESLESVPDDTDFLSVQCHREWCLDHLGFPSYQQYSPDENSNECKVWEEVEEYIESKVELPEI